MTNAKLLAMLREARKYVCACRIDSVIPCDCKDRVPAWQLLDRIDAALAEPLDSATPVVESEVEWKDSLACDETTFLSATIGERHVFVYPEEATADSFPWRASLVRSKTGTAPTLDEAKSAAIRAARGLK